MNHIDRRSLFSLGLASAGAAMTPTWLRRWFQDPQKAQPRDPYPKKTEEERQLAAAREAQLQKAIEQARTWHKPLLVFVVPDRDVDAESSRGMWFGAFVTHGGDLSKLELGMAVPCCAKPSEVAKLLGAEVVGTPAMLWVDVAAAGEKSRATPVEVELGDYHMAMADGEEWDAYNLRAKARIEQQLAVIGEALLTARHRHGASLAALAKANAAALTDVEQQQIALWLAGNQLPEPALLARATAFVRHAIEDFEQPRRSARSAQLVAAIDKVVVREELAGARWRTSGGGCGGEFERPTEEEKRQSGMIACGMGMVTPLAERFLDFYVKQQ